MMRWRWLVLLTLVTIFAAAVSGGCDLCCGNACGIVDVKRSYDRDALRFEVAGPFKMNSRTRSAVHSFKLGPLQTLKGVGFGYRAVSGNERGEDVKLYRLSPDKLDEYHAMIQGGGGCPAPWFQSNMQITVLIGADDSISRKLSALGSTGVSHVERPYTYEGHSLSYIKTLLEGSEDLSAPLLDHENAISNVGSARVPYDYFLVTGVVATGAST